MQRRSPSRTGAATAPSTRRRASRRPGSGFRAAEEAATSAANRSRQRQRRPQERVPSPNRPRALVERQGASEQAPSGDPRSARNRTARAPQRGKSWGPESKRPSRPRPAHPPQRGGPPPSPLREPPTARLPHPKPELVRLAEPRDVRSLLLPELQSTLAAANEPPFRATQITEWLYRRRATNWEAMTNLPRPLRQRLAQQFSLRSLELRVVQGSADTTRKFLWRLVDGAFIESVLIPANPALYGESSDRVTLCVSTQVGCAYGCRFCASGLGGWQRNLQPYEIVEQVLATERWHATQPDTVPNDRFITNLVIMGMGEPLANYDHLLRALRILNAEWGGRIGARRITISTCGLVPQIRRLATEPEQFGLAISLHGATDPVRERIMPVNRKYPLAQLVPACEAYVAGKGRIITLEYILIAGVNDGREQAAPLAQIARRLHAKVNLIPYNRVEGLPWERPDEASQERFLDALIERGARATLRREKGHDIDAACGQLRLKTERTLGEEAPGNLS